MMKACELNRTITQTFVKIIAYADDVAVVARSRINLKKQFRESTQKQENEN